jgi:hypothetical protein
MTPAGLAEVPDQRSPQQAVLAPGGQLRDRYQSATR